MDYQTPQLNRLTPDDRGALKLLGIIHCFIGGLEVSGAILMWTLNSTMILDQPVMRHFAMVALIPMSISLASGISMIRRRYSTFSTIIASITRLVIPIGTILGIWTLVVLNKPGVQAIYRERSDESESV
ncbi:MAG: hypothetical protein ABSB33_01800 [Tepidisphaeraceae bacterium]|jgi:hypothetical protein